MKVGIVEICEPNHYTAVLALAQTYSINPLNEVIIFTTENIKPLFKEVFEIIEVITLSEGKSIEEFLSSIASYSFDRIHINTISKYFKDFANVKWSGSMYFTVHNIDLWYDNSLFKRSRTLFADYQSLIIDRKKSDFRQPLILFIKDFWRQYFRNIFIKKISKLNYKILVYSNSQKQHLERYLSSEKIIVFPFCLHTNFKDSSSLNTKLRLCIPGSVSNQRRNYSELFETLKRRLTSVKQNFTIDLLGYIPDDNRFLINEIELLKTRGFDIIYNEGFIAIAEYNERLERCDLILGNLKVQMNIFRKYGETKETGIIFNIIKSGKPGILPNEYPVDEELKDICLFFKDYDDLAELIFKLDNDSSALRILKQEARNVVKHYLPENLYHLLEAKE